MKATASIFLSGVLTALAASGAETVTVDFSRETGAVKELHGVNNAPVRVWEGLRQWELGEAGVPYVRTHDTAGMYGGAHFVDIPNVFPDFDADENDPKSYDFALTDAFLKPVVAAGARVYYRLGVTIESYYAIKSYNIAPPKDFAKWARVCEHIVRHYNEGWANGFKWDIPYWEIWGEPENPPLWAGTKEQYFELYRITANHLKRCFPTIKVGGYGSCGLYAIDDPKASDQQKGFVTFLDEFLAYVTDPKTKAPLDFFSWHLYFFDTAARLTTHADYVRQRLDKYGLQATESHLNEWNRVGPKWNEYDEMKEMLGAACVGEAFCRMQNGPVDKAMYYDAMPSRRYCGLFYFPSGRRTPTYWTFWLWNRLFACGRAVAVTAPTGKGLEVVAASGRGRKAVFAVNDSSEARTLGFRLPKADWRIRLLDATYDPKTEKPPEARAFDPAKPVVLPARSVLLIDTGAEPRASDRGVEKKIFAGQG